MFELLLQCSTTIYYKYIYSLYILCFKTINVCEFNNNKFMLMLTSCVPVRHSVMFEPINANSVRTDKNIGVTSIVGLLLNVPIGGRISP